jgi:hypothetical protein
VRIRNYKAGGDIEEYWTDLSVEAAKDVICQWVTDGLSERVEIVDSEGEVVFNFPPEAGHA